MKQPRYRVVDLCSGIGGLSLGLEQPERLNDLGELGYENIGFESQVYETILAVEKDEHAAQGFQSNFNSEVINDDIRNVTSFSSWDDADVIVAGLPCQGFSNLNSTRTEALDDDRNELWKEFIRAVKTIDPDVFLIENVPRFLATDQAAELVKSVTDLGYSTVVDELWAHDYGVPQKRKRAFVLGSKLGVPFFPEPTDEEVKTVEDAIGDLPAEPTDENWHGGRNVTETSRKRMQAVPPGGNRFDIPEDLLPPCWQNYEGSGTDLYGRLWWDRPSVTIRADFVKPEKGRYLHPEENRSITIREGARLQTLPDNFKFGSGYKKYVTSQVGNAVPPKLAYHIGAAIFAHLEGVEGAFARDSDTKHDHLRKADPISWSKLESFTSVTTGLT